MSTYPHADAAKTKAKAPSIRYTYTCTLQTAVVARAWFVWLILTSLGNTGRCRCAPEYWMGSLGTLSRSYHFQQIALKVKSSILSNDNK